MPTNDWFTRFEEAGVIWRHEGGKKPHLRLTSGLHTGGYFNAEALLMLSHAELFLDVCKVIAERIVSVCKVNKVDYLVVPISSAATFAYQIVEIINNGLEEKSLEVYPILVENKDGDKMVSISNLKNMEAGSRCIFFDDVFTTGSTFTPISSALLSVQCILGDTGVVIVNRSHSSEYGGMRILSLLKRSFPAWEPGDCTLCKAGSPHVSAEELFALQTG